MPDPATVTDARSVAETRLTNLAAATSSTRRPPSLSYGPCSGPPRTRPQAPTAPSPIRPSSSPSTTATPSASSASSGEASLTIPSPRGLSGSRCRLAGINTPELNDADPGDRARAREARDRLRLARP